MEDDLEKLKSGSSPSRIIAKEVLARRPWSE